MYLFHIYIALYLFILAPLITKRALRIEWSWVNKHYYFLLVMNFQEKFVTIFIKDRDVKKMCLQSQYADEKRFITNQISGPQSGHRGKHTFFKYE